MEIALFAGLNAARALRLRRARAQYFSIELLTPTHYARLGVPESADVAAIEDAWKRLRPPASRGAGSDNLPLRAVAWPQSGKAESPVVRLRQRELAYAVLSDPSRKAIYDAWLADHRDEITSPPHTPRWQAWLHSRGSHRLLGGMTALIGAALLAWLMS